MTQVNGLNDFDQARALLLSFFQEDGDDSRLPEALMAVRTTCSEDTFNRILILADAAGDPRFFGAADVLALLRDLEISSDVKADAERLLSLIAEQDAAARTQAEQEAAEQANPYRQAAIRLLTKFRQPNCAQVTWALAHL